MTEPPVDPSVRFEPSMEDEPPAGAPSEGPPSEDSVWEEPALSTQLAGRTPADVVTYGRWMQEARRQTSRGTTWLVTALVALLAGPWGVLGAFLGAGGGASYLIVVAVVAPLTEEVVKISAPLYLAERRPHLFALRTQILLCAGASGLVFAVIENVLYLNVYIPEPSEDIVLWRWSVCVALHTGCSLLAGVGVARMWKDSWQRHARPRASLAAPFIAAAAVVHGVYNGLATVISLLQAPAGSC